MTGQRQFQPAAQHRAEQRRHNGPVLRLDPRQQRVERTRGEARLIEHRDITARDKGPPRAGNHQPGQAAVRLERIQPLCQPRDHPRRDRIDRRVVDPQRGDAACAAQGQGGAFAGWAGHGRHR